MECTTANETFLDDKKYNIWAIRTGAIVADAINYNKLINAYLKKNDQPLDKSEEYMSKYTKDEFCDLLLQFYDIKGNITPEKILSAKKRATDPSDWSEHDIQKNVCLYLKEHKFMYWAVPNGFIHGGSALETAKYINYLKQEGFRAGTFDMTILYGNAQVAFLEIKTKKGKPSDKQLKMRDYLTEKGYKNTIAYGYDECIDFINGLL